MVARVERGGGGKFYLSCQRYWGGGVRSYYSFCTGGEFKFTLCRVVLISEPPPDIIAQSLISHFDVHIAHRFLQIGEISPYPYPSPSLPGLSKISKGSARLGFRIDQVQGDV